MGNNKEKEIVFEIGGEGGSIAIYCEKDKNGIKFIYNHNEIDFSDEGLSINKSDVYEDFESAFQIINERYPWHFLYLLTVNDTYKEYVSNHLINKLNQQKVLSDDFQSRTDFEEKLGVKFEFDKGKNIWKKAIKYKIKTAFENAKADYIKVFQKFYPAHESNGFTERNQTFFFTHNYLTNNKDAICWQEVPFHEKQHVDTVIIDDNSIIYIESKRIKSRNKIGSIDNPIKGSIANDISRLLDNSNRKKILNGLKGGKSGYKEYILFLVDVWAEGDFKNSTINNWQNGFLNEALKINEQNLCIKNVDNQLFKFGAFTNSNDKAINTFVHEAINNYSIAYSLFEITNGICVE